jgi:chromosomal replication initiator protein
VLKGEVTAVLNDATELWDQAISYLNQRNTNENSQIAVYLDYLTPESLLDNELIVSTSNKFAKNHIEKNYSPLIKDAIFSVVGIDYELRIIYSEQSQPQQTVYQRMGTSTGGSVAQPGQPNQLGQQSQPGQNSQAGQLDLVSQGTHPAYPAQTSHPFQPSPPALLTPAGQPFQPATTTVLPQAGQGSQIGHAGHAGYANHPNNQPTMGLGSATTTIQTPSTSNMLLYTSVEAEDNSPVVLSDERTFASFIVGDSNRYAFSAALGVSKKPGKIYNPLFIYGSSGLGKTHLLLAIENYIKVHHPYLKTTYAQTSDFVRDFTRMIYDDQKRLEFERQYHHVDVILLDDVQYLEGKVETTGEVFQIFNDFTAQNKQIVLSADRAPVNIDLDERYKSRFASGITIDIQPPNFETKHAIFDNYLEYCCHKIERQDIRELFSQEIVNRIIELSSDNIRELEGATASLVHYLSTRPKERHFEVLTMEETEKCISNVFMRSEEKRIDIGIIQKEVEGFFKISHEDMIGKKRSRGISFPRHIAMYLCRNMTGESFPDIGKAFGGKDHTSVMYACDNIEKVRQLEPDVERDIKYLVGQIRK